MTLNRIHIALPVRDLHASMGFYARLFGEPAAKVRNGYAKFEPADPPVNLSLNVVSDAQAPSAPAHFGIEVASPDAVKRATARFRSAGVETLVEEAESCCYAVQDKVWVADPDGHRWEVFVVLDPDPPTCASTARRDAASPCCPSQLCSPSRPTGAVEDRVR